ncbi:ubiquitin-conjugating enzyme E2-17 kDa, putative [Entamoeba dispar SAW760]|uniref:Ubiquitin-conjugating enzyme E2-17 kDa, putative n=1 Tax=Entamoeba dispar (strain ATCC PRA-260 / SAW760) TaxID=370354 RepID=B0EMT7_ENTDS|nr:ubiquitin-conjugating enzyme E2-17 kDa, putative [Entamoeba dispar SAW760]EDR24162.1 ubiquitin-conjugating enzyme E2-17 kDa, putative [Entamoeba dispar SAW760]|eukprot:EDR24162.1 ubiquitin-conjugating enzyme E2-17 kDa, putative [Entamoeba dispar SAW760]
MSSSGSIALLRLTADLKTMLTDPPVGISSGPIDESNLYFWQATIAGPENSPFEGGLFELRLTFSDEYPIKPPHVKFISEMFHPNVFKDGRICLDILQDKWSSVYSVSTILLAIQSLLTDPNPNSPANPQASALYTSNRKEYNKLVRACAERSLECN